LHLGRDAGVYDVDIHAHQPAGSQPGVNGMGVGGALGSNRVNGVRPRLPARCYRRLAVDRDRLVTVGDKVVHGYLRALERLAPSSRQVVQQPARSRTTRAPWYWQ
jgi:hypothetical protein